MNLARKLNIFTFIWINILIFSFVFQNSEASKLIKRRESRILGGKGAIPHEFPSLVSLQYPSIGHFCAGSIVGDKWILTAAHCTGEADPSLVTIVAGEHNIRVTETNDQRRKVKKIFVHPSYDRAQLAYDVALIELSAPLNFSSKSVQPVEFAPNNFTLNYFDSQNKSASAITVGWGLLGGNGPVSDVVQKVSVPLVTEERCKEQYAETPYQVLPSMICAGAKGMAACLGDSGGPLFCQRETNNKQKTNSDGFQKQPYILCGIVSGGLACGKEDFAGFYSRASSVSEWISATIFANKTAVV